MPYFHTESPKSPQAMATKSPTKCKNINQEQQCIAIFFKKRKKVQKGTRLWTHDVKDWPRVDPGPQPKVVALRSMVTPLTSP